MSPMIPHDSVPLERILEMRKAYEAALKHGRYRRITPDEFVHLIMDGYNGDEYWQISQGRATQQRFTQSLDAVRHWIPAANHDDLYFSTRPLVDKRRIAEKVAASRILIADFDLAKVDVVDELPYALSFLFQGDTEASGFLASWGLPRPHVAVMSGAGIHAYWILDEVLPPAEGARLQRWLTQNLETVLKSSDPAVKDLSRLLRLPGSVNRKYGDGLPVIAWAQTEMADSVHARALLETIPDRVDRPLRSATGAKNRASASTAPFAANGSARRILDLCPSLAWDAEHADTLIPEPRWHKDITVVMTAADGREAAHSLSAGDPRYSPEETDVKIDHALRFLQDGEGGPATCRTLAELGGHCDGCRFKGRITSPAQLRMTSVGSAASVSDSNPADLSNTSAEAAEWAFESTADALSAVAQLGPTIKGKFGYNLRHPLDQFFQAALPHYAEWEDDAMRQLFDALTDHRGRRSPREFRDEITRIGREIWERNHPPLDRPSSPEDVMRQLDDLSDATDDAVIGQLFDETFLDSILELEKSPANYERVTARIRNLISEHALSWRNWKKALGDRRRVLGASGWLVFGKLEEQAPELPTRCGEYDLSCMVVPQVKNGMFILPDSEIPLCSVAVPVAVVNNADGTRRFTRWAILKFSPEEPSWVLKNVPPDYHRDSFALKKPDWDPLIIQSLPGRVQPVLIEIEQRNIAQLQFLHAVEAYGWVDDRFTNFVTGDGDLDGGTHLMSSQNTQQSQVAAYKRSGTFDVWRQTIATVIHRDDGRIRPIILVILGAALAGPLLGARKEPSGLVVLSAPYASGKSWTLMIGSTVWGNPDTLVASWDSTATARERLMAATRHTVTIFDDLKLLLNSRGEEGMKELSTTVYAIHGGTGRGRGTSQSGQLDNVATWAQLVLTSHEATILHDREISGRGAQTRIVEIPSEPFEAKTDKIATLINDALKTLKGANGVPGHYGHAGLAWARIIRDAEDHLSERYDEMAARIRILCQESGIDAGNASRLVALWTPILMGAAQVLHWTSGGEEFDPYPPTIMDRHWDQLSATVLQSVSRLRGRTAVRAAAEAIQTFIGSYLHEINETTEWIGHRYPVPAAWLEAEQELRMTGPNIDTFILKRAGIASSARELLRDVPWATYKSSQRYSKAMHTSGYAINLPKLNEWLAQCDSPDWSTDVDPHHPLPF